MYKPHIPMLAGDNLRRGCFDDEQFASVREKLPEALRPVPTFAYISGWRIQSEILPMQWRFVCAKESAG